MRQKLYGSIPEKKEGYIGKKCGDGAADSSKKVKVTLETKKKKSREGKELV